MRRFGNFGWITSIRCPSGALLTSTSLQVCFCDAISDIGETPYLGGVTLSVDGDTTTWTLSNPQAVSAKCLTYDISAAIEPGSVILFQYDGTWTAPADAVDISVSNTLDGAAYTVTFDSDALSMGGDVTDYVAYIKADDFKSRLSADANDIKFKQGATNLSHECVRRDRLLGHGATYLNVANFNPVVHNDCLYMQAIGASAEQGVYALEIDLETWEKTEVNLNDTDVASDDHNVGSFWFAANGNITAFYSGHGADKSIRYRTGTSLTGLGVEQTITTDENCTYPRAIPINDGSGRGFLFYRGGSATQWDYLYTLNDGSSWSGPNDFLGVASGATGLYLSLCARPGSPYVFDVLAADQGAADDSNDTKIYHLVVTFDQSTMAATWTVPSTGTPITGTVNVDDGDLIFTPTAGAVKQDVNPWILDRGDDGNLHALLYVKTTSVANDAPSEIVYAVYDGSWTTEVAVDQNYRLLNMDQSEYVPGADFASLPSDGKAEIWSVRVDSTSNNKYVMERYRRDSAGSWSLQETVNPSLPFTDATAGNAWDCRNPITPRTWSTQRLAPQKFIEVVYESGWKKRYVSNHNMGICAFPGIPDAYYVKVPTLSSGSDTTIKAIVGYGYDTSQEARATVWSDYEMVLHGGLYPGSWQLINSAYANAAADPMALEYPMNATADGTFVTADNPLGGNSILEPGSRGSQGGSQIKPDSTDAWVTAQTIDFVDATDWTVEGYFRTSMRSDVSWHVLFSTEAGSETGKAGVLVGLKRNVGDADGYLFAQIRLSNGTVKARALNTVDTDAIQKDTWHHFSVTWSGSQLAGYIDGVITNSPFNEAVGTMENESTVGPMSIGNALSNTSLPLDGEIAEMRVALDASEDRVLATAANYSDYDNFVTIA